MNSAKVVSEKVRELEATAQNIITRAISLIKAVPAYPYYDEETGDVDDEEWDWTYLEGENKSQRNALLRHYEQWYTARYHTNYCVMNIYMFSDKIGHTMRLMRFYRVLFVLRSSKCTKAKRR